MKRTLAALLVMVMLLGLAGCGGNQGEANKPIDVTETTPTPAMTEDPEAGKGEKVFDAGDGLGMIAASDTVTLALRMDGTVISAGNGQAGQRKVSQWRDVKYIAAGSTVSVGVKNDGTVVLAGTLSDAAALESIAAWTGAVAAAAGADHVAALLEGGTVVAAGNDGEGQCKVTNWSDIMDIAAGYNFTVGLQSNGVPVITAGGPDVSKWTDIADISASGDTVTGITSEGKVVSTAAVAGLDALTGVVSAAASAAGAVCVLEDGTLFTSFAAEIVPDEDYSVGVVDLSTVTNGVAVAMGARHAAVMSKDGLVSAYGVNDDLECETAIFRLRPYVETVGEDKFLRGLPVGATVAEAKALISTVTGAADIAVALPAAGAGEEGEAEDEAEGEAEGAEAAVTPAVAADDAAIIATGMNVSVGGVAYATVIILGDVNSDGAIDQLDADAFAKIVAFETRLSDPAIIRASELYRNNYHELAVSEARTMPIINAAVAGTAPITQYDTLTTGVYDERMGAAKLENGDVKGWIAIPDTNINYPIMVETKDWKYNYYNWKGEEDKIGSAYMFYNLPLQGQFRCITAHNNRVHAGQETSMFHELHHVQEHNDGLTNCLWTKHCGVELTDALPDLKIYSNRVWRIDINGEESLWEIYSMYETESGTDILYENIWFNSENSLWVSNEEAKFGSRGTKIVRDADTVQAWIDKQTAASTIDFGVKVTSEEQLLTIYTCASMAEDANDGGRLFFFLHQVG